MFKALRKLFCRPVEETRVIQSRDFNAELAKKLSNAINNHLLKPYAGVVKFINDHGVPANPVDMDSIGSTPEIVKLKKLWESRKYKCSDFDLKRFMES